MQPTPKQLDTLYRLYGRELPVRSRLEASHYIELALEVQRCADLDFQYNVWPRAAQKAITSLITAG